MQRSSRLLVIPRFLPQTLCQQTHLHCITPSRQYFTQNFPILLNSKSKTVSKTIASPPSTLLSLCVVYQKHVRVYGPGIMTPGYVAPVVCYCLQLLDNISTGICSVWGKVYRLPVCFLILNYAEVCIHMVLPVHPLPFRFWIAIKLYFFLIPEHRDNCFLYEVALALLRQCRIASTISICASQYGIVDPSFTCFLNHFLCPPLRCSIGELAAFTERLSDSRQYTFSFVYGYTSAVDAIMNCLTLVVKIGRASCRERV